MSDRARDLLERWLVPMDRAEWERCRADTIAYLREPASETPKEEPYLHAYGKPGCNCPDCEARRKGVPVPAPVEHPEPKESE